MLKVKIEINIVYCAIRIPIEEIVHFKSHNIVASPLRRTWDIVMHLNMLLFSNYSDDDVSRKEIYQKLKYHKSLVKERN